MKRGFEKGEGELRKLSFKKYVEIIILTVSVTLVITGVLNGDYELIRDLVRYICTSCLGLG